MGQKLKFLPLLALGLKQHLLPAQHQESLQPPG